MWRYDAEGMQLRCLHAYHADTDEHDPDESLETLSLAGDDNYIATL